MQEEGIRMAIRYGIHLKVLPSNGDHADKLTHLIKQVGYYLKQQQRPTQGSALRILSHVI